MTRPTTYVMAGELTSGYDGANPGVSSMSPDDFALKLLTLLWDVQRGRLTVDEMRALVAIAVRAEIRDAVRERDRQWENLVSYTMEEAASVAADTSTHLAAR